MNVTNDNKADSSIGKNAGSGTNSQETRVAIISIVVESPEHVEELNHILHGYSKYIIGRMGIPYEKRAISLISVAMDAPSDEISAMTGKIGMLKGITSKALYAKL